MSHNEESEYRRERRERRQRVNKIWMWVGVVVLCLILLFWIFDIGTFLGPNQ